MVFNAVEENDYILHRPLLNIYLYNVSDRSYKLIFRRVSNIVTDGLGKYIIAFDFDKRNWLLYDCQKRILKECEIGNLSRTFPAVFIGIPHRILRKKPHSPKDFLICFKG